MTAAYRCTVHSIYVTRNWAPMTVSDARGSSLPVHGDRDQPCTGSDGHDQYSNERFNLVHGGLCSGEGAQRHEASNDGAENQDEGEEGSHGQIFSYDTNLVPLFFSVLRNCAEQGSAALRTNGVA